MKPVVGVMPLWDDEKESIWMLPGYMDGIRVAGGIPFIFPLSDDAEELKRLADMCDGFLFTGGHDVSPEIYNEKPIGEGVLCCEKETPWRCSFSKKRLKPTSLSLEYAEAFSL